MGTRGGTPTRGKYQDLGLNATDGMERSGRPSLRVLLGSLPSQELSGCQVLSREGRVSGT